MQRDFKHCLPKDAPKNVPVAVFVDAYYRVAVQFNKTSGWTSHTANSEFPPMFPETILYTHGW
jgi:hypothetical protein